MTLRGRIWCVVGACGGAGSSLVAHGVARAVAEVVPGVTLVDLDPDGVHAGMMGISTLSGTGARAWAGDGEFTALQIRSATIPVTGIGGLLVAPEGCDTHAVLCGMAACDDLGPVVADCGSGASAARRVPPGVPCIVVVTRDAAGVRAAELTFSALPDAAVRLVVVNEGCRRADVGARAVARVVGCGHTVVLPGHDRDAQRLDAGHLPGGRSRLATALREIASRTVCADADTRKGIGEEAA